MGVLQFGAFELNRQERQLRKHGVRIRMPEQCLIALSLLLERPGQVVTREEFRKHLWPEDTHVEFDDNLNTIIRGVREALGDSAKNPRFIETAPRHGYRFVAPVSGTTAVTVALAPLEPPRRRRLVYVLAGLGVLALLLGSAWWFIWGGGRTAQPLQPATALTSYVGQVGHPTYSPDGRKIAFHWNGKDQSGFDIYVRALGSEQLLQLTASPADDRFPAWSPDGRDVAFVRNLPNNQAAIMLVPAPGGPEREVAVIPGTQVPVSWSPDGKWIAYSVSFPDYVRTTGERAGIFAVSLETRQSVRITTPGSRFLGDGYPAFSPDGRTLAFFRMSSFGASDLHVVDIDRALRPTGEPRKLTFDARSAQNPAWTPDGKEIIFVSDRGGSHSVWKVRASGGAPVSLGGESALEPAISPSGRQVIYARQRLIDNLARVELCGLGCPPGPERRLTRSARLARNPSISPDGRRIVFESQRSGHDEIWVCDGDGSNQRQLTFFRGPATGTPRWSPDSRQIVFDSRVDGKGQLFIMDAEGGTPRQITGEPVEHIVPSWSQDGAFVYYASNRTGEFQVWKRPVNGGAPTQVTTQGGFYAIEGRDGRFVYYSKGIVRTSVWKVPAGGGQESLVVESLSHSQDFSVSQNGIYFVPSSSVTNTVSIYFYDFATRNLRLALTTDGIRLSGLSVPADARSIVYSKRESAESDLMLVQLPR
ncbi:MAG TPA: winged helix-turn-helix domain-containing protein [Bryobacteraceae bacterium]|nr:winged helix-turn-helix domain-containing protein [Bryobacteraceae bacterium]